MTNNFFDWVLEEIEDKFKYIAIGSGDTEESADDTELDEEIATDGGERALAITDIDNNVLTISKEFEITGELTVNEAGIFDADENGMLGSRKVIENPIELVDGDFFEVVFEITVQEGE